MIAVIGAGAAGTIAAIAAAQNGGEVVLFEKNDRIGKKLMITGKGRCNLTNICTEEDFFDSVIVNKRFLYSAVRSFSNYDVIDFFENLGVKTKVERGGRVFPESDSAKEVTRALENKIKELGIKIVFSGVTELIIQNEEIKGVKTENGIYYCDKVIIATGGKSYPKTGSTGDGYRLAKEAGHTVTNIYPALVPLETYEDVNLVMGLSLRNVSVKAKNKKGETVFSDFGEMLFSHYGLTGPLILSASCHLGENPEGAEVMIDLKPALSEKQLDERILRDFELYKNKNFENSLSDLLPKKLIAFVVEKSGISPHKKVNTITKEERKKLLMLLKEMPFKVKKYRPISEAIVCGGGVAVNEINPSTMESKKVRGLYFAGEVIDLHAYTGGFNLQIAFSTGHLAGRNAAR